MDGGDARQLVADTDSDGPRRHARQRTVEEAGPVAQAVARAVPAVHGQQEHGGDDGIRARRIGDAERALGERHTGMPLAKDERLVRGDDHGQRGDGAPVAERLGERSGVVLAADGPAEPKPRRGETGERALEVRVEAPAEAFDGGGVERLARGDEAFTLALSPGGELVRFHLPALEAVWLECRLWPAGQLEQFERVE